jgi:hypothetical protein
MTKPAGVSRYSLIAWPFPVILRSLQSLLQEILSAYRLARFHSSLIDRSILFWHTVMGLVCMKETSSTENDIFLSFFSFSPFLSSPSHPNPYFPATPFHYIKVHLFCYTHLFDTHRTIMPASGTGPEHHRTREPGTTTSTTQLRRISSLTTTRPAHLHHK